jgi:HK97 family phage major capsid protein
MARQTTSPLKGIYQDQEFQVQEYLPDSLFLQAATIAGDIQGDSPAVRVPYVSQDPTVGFVAEGAEINENDPTLDEVLITTAKLAVLVSQSNESLAYPTAGQLITSSLTRTLTQKADHVFLQNTPAQKTSQPTGLLNTTSTTQGPAWGGDDPTKDLDAIATAISQIEANNGQATHIIMSPTAWLHYASLKDKNSNYQLGQPGTTVTRQLWGLPVLTSSQAPDDKIAVIDKTTIIGATSGLKLTLSDQAAFTSDSVLWRCTWRLGWNTPHPERNAILTKTA